MHKLQHRQGVKFLFIFIFIGGLLLSFVFISAGIVEIRSTFVKTTV